MKVRILTLLFILIAFYVTAQTAIPDTIKIEFNEEEIDSLLNEFEELDNDSLASPDETLYKNIWSTTQIRYPANTLPAKDDTIVITLIEPNDSKFYFPVNGKVISKYGYRGRRMHTGTDIKLSSGDSVRNAFDGRVRLAKRYSGYGNLVLVRHNNGLETIYAHLKTISVKVNDSVKAGDLLGLGGRTGRATTDHLHFETRIFGEPFDSNKYIDFENRTLRSEMVYYKNKQVEIELENFRKKPENVLASASAVGQIRHVIRKGDTLSAIARKYNTSVKRICAANNITPQKVLKIGSVLKIS